MIYKFFRKGGGALNEKFKEAKIEGDAEKEKIRKFLNDITPEKAWIRMKVVNFAAGKGITISDVFRKILEVLPKDTGQQS